MNAAPMIVTFRTDWDYVLVVTPPNLVVDSFQQVMHNNRLPPTHTTRLAGNEVEMLLALSGPRLDALGLLSFGAWGEVVH